VRESAPPADDWPTLPKLDLSQSPGRLLAVRVPAESSGAFGALGCLIPFTAVWVTMVCAAGFPILQGHLRGKPDWCMTLGLLPFVLAGVILVGVILLVLVQVFTGALVGSVRLELSAHPLVAGRRYELLVQQAGLVRLRRVSITLKCMEWATYTAGTSTTTVSHTAHEQELAYAPTSAGDEGGGLRCTFEVPAEAMHSFEAKNNKILWRVVVRGRMGVLPSSTSFPVVVYPSGAEGV
jgi:hypothetical protein